MHQLLRAKRTDFHIRFQNTQEKKKITQESWDQVLEQLADNLGAYQRGLV